MNLAAQGDGRELNFGVGDYKNKMIDTWINKKNIVV
jgi:hypothetical protein